MKTIKTFFYIITIFFVTACSKHDSFHGYNFDPQASTMLKIGSTTESQVEELLGSPTIISNFGDQSYYYISLHQQNRAFLKPDTISQQILKVSFKNGIIDSIKNYSLKEAHPIEYIGNQIRIKGNEISIFEQIFNNIGKFNQPRPQR